MYKDRDDLIIMFTDSYDVVFLAEPETILSEFYNMKAIKVLCAYFSHRQQMKRMHKADKV